MDQVAQLDRARKYQPMRFDKIAHSNIKDFARGARGRWFESNPDP